MREARLRTVANLLNLAALADCSERTCLFFPHDGLAQASPILDRAPAG
jgi:hypothetical protein